MGLTEFHVFYPETSIGKKRFVIEIKKKKKDKKKIFSCSQMTEV